MLVRNLFMSVDPYMRGRMNEGPSYVPPFEIGKPLEGGAVGDVIESRAPEFKPGVKAGDVIFISGAAGAVGNVAGQLAKLRGCRVIGSAGSADKVRVLRDECGFDAAFNFKAGPVAEQLKRKAPEGIDVYFDNVGGETLQAALSALHLHGRIVACGGISGYNAEQPRPGPSNLFNITTRRLTMKGFIVSDWMDRRAEFERELGGYFKAGKLKNLETREKGIDQAVGAFLGLFQGRNVGKMVIDLVCPQ